MKSIRQYLLLGLFGALLLSSCASFLISYVASTHEISELHDAQLIENSRFIEGFLNQKPHKLNIEQIKAHRGGSARCPGISHGACKILFVQTDVFLL